MNDVVSKTGMLYPYFETGTEGILWSLVQDGKAGYDALHILEDGDRLKVWEKVSGRPVLDIIIRYDHKVGMQEIRAYKGQAALGMWVNGIQEGYLPDEWAQLFVRTPDMPELRAEVLVRQKRDKVDRQTNKASPRRWRSKKASTMARSTGKSRFASGRRGSGRSSKR